MLFLVVTDEKKGSIIISYFRICFKPITRLPTRALNTDLAVVESGCVSYVEPSLFGHNENPRKQTKKTMKKKSKQNLGFFFHTKKI